MKRKYFIIALSVLLVALFALPAWAAYSEAQAEELKELFEQQQAVQFSILDKQVEMGLVSEEDALEMKERMAEQYERRNDLVSEGEYAPRQSRRQGGMMSGGFGGRHCFEDDVVGSKTRTY